MAKLTETTDIFGIPLHEDALEEAEYQGRKVTLNKPFRTPDGPKKFSVYTKNEKGNVVKVNFGDPNMEIKRDDPERRKNFRARHNCDNPGPKWKARYWSCQATWHPTKKVSDVVESAGNILSTDALVDYIEDLSDGADRESIENFLKGGHGHLVTVPVSAISPGPEEVNLQSPKKLKKYSKLPSSSSPPIVIDSDNVIIDGHHRWKAAKIRGDKTILAYKVCYRDDDSFGESLDQWGMPGPVLEAERKVMACPNCGPQSSFKKVIDTSKPIPAAPERLPLAWQCTNCFYEKPIKFRRGPLEIPGDEEPQS